jgi:hypothetical protein
MPTAVKVALIFEGGEGYGWSEIHYWLSSSGSPNLQARIDNIIANLVPPRIYLLGYDCSLVGMRVSYPIQNGIAALGRRQKWQGTGPVQSQSSQESLAINWIDASNSKHKITHLRGFWNSIVVAESYHPELDGRWEPGLLNYKSALIDGGYGWPSRDVSKSCNGTVSNYVVAPSGIVTFTVSPTTGLLPTDGNLYQVRFSRLNRSTSVLNRSILCSVTGPTTLTSVNAHAASPFISAGRFNLRIPSFIGYNQTGSISVGERRMGRPLNRYPGRRRAQPTS